MHTQQQSHAVPRSAYPDVAPHLHAAVIDESWLSEQGQESEHEEVSAAEALADWAAYEQHNEAELIAMLEEHIRINSPQQQTAAAHAAPQG